MRKTARNTFDVAILAPKRPEIWHWTASGALSDKARYETERPSQQWQAQKDHSPSAVTQMSNGHLR
jgi:hypothetical protein